MSTTPTREQIGAAVDVLDWLRSVMADRTRRTGARGPFRDEITRVRGTLSDIYARAGLEGLDLEQLVEWRPGGLR